MFVLKGSNDVVLISNTFVLLNKSDAPIPDYDLDPFKPGTTTDNIVLPCHQCSYWLELLLLHHVNMRVGWKE